MLSISPARDRAYRLRATLFAVFSRIRHQIRAPGGHKQLPRM